jgi:imidazolonepropionase-like amidohydrolase
MKKAILLLCLLAGLSLVQAETPGTLAIRNARVVTVSGPVISKGTVLVRNGLVEAVGENVAVPPDAWVIDGEGLTVYPGLIDALSSWGLPGAAPAAPVTGGRGGGAPAPAQAGAAGAFTPPQIQTLADGGPEARPQTTSWVKAADLVQNTDRTIIAARDAGFTTAFAFPMTGIFAGQGSAIDLSGERFGQMVVAPSLGQYITMPNRGFGGSFPGSLFGVMAYVRQIYLDAGYYKMSKEMYEQNPKGMKRPAYDRALEGVLESKRILLPAVRVVEIDRMARFAAELKQPVILYGGHEAWRSTDALVKYKTPVLVSLKWPERDRDADPDTIESMRTLENRDRAPSTPAALLKAGVPFAFYSGGIDRPADIRKAVKKAIDAGLSSDDALKALTLSPARLFGLDDRLGSIEPGKIANLVIATGDLFDEKTKVKYIVVDGAKFEPAPEAPAAPGATPSGANN